MGIGFGSLLCLVVTLIVIVRLIMKCKSRRGCRQLKEPIIQEECKM